MSYNQYNSVKKFEERMIKNTIAPLPRLPSPEEACKYCYQCGYCWMNIEGISVWVYCKCGDGKLKSESDRYNLPRLDNEMLSLFQANKFPIQAFTPHINGTVMTQIKERMRRFQQDLRDSVKFWESK